VKNEIFKKEERKKGSIFLTGSRERGCGRGSGGRILCVVKWKLAILISLLEKGGPVLLDASQCLFMKPL